jgi:Flp pilus assembly protein TadD
LGVITALEGDLNRAEVLFRKAILQSRGNFPNSHNNLGVMLARKGQLQEAKREFQIALKQAAGALPEAEQNLTLCQALLNGSSRAQVSALISR